MEAASTSFSRLNSRITEVILLTEEWPGLINNISFVEKEKSTVQGGLIVILVISGSLPSREQRLEAF